MAPTETDPLLKPSSRPGVAIVETQPEQTDFDVLDDEENPKHWSALQKWLCAVLVSKYALMGPVSAAMTVPALVQISQDLEITGESLTQMLLSIFVLGWGFGPLIWAPLSEVYGRSRLLNIGHTSFLILNSLCAITTNKWLFLAFRLLSGLLGSAPLALGGGVLSDLWIPEERGRSLAIYTLIPLLGPAIGPILGGFMIRRFTWHWIFAVVSVFTALSLVLGVLLLRETFAPVLLRRKRLAAGFREPRDSQAAMLSKFLRHDLRRPFVLLGTQPLIQVLAIIMSYLFGLNFLTISTFQSLWRDLYGQPSDVASLNYVSIALGFVVGCESAGPLNDLIYNRAKKRNGGKGEPEFRTYLMMPASLLVPIGLLIYGWSAEMRLQPIVLNLGIAIYCAGLVVAYQCIHSYTIDCYPTFAASAIGALTVLRAVAGFVFPVLGPMLWHGLGYGWGSSVLACVSLVLGSLAPVLLLYAGPWLRARSKYASGDVKVAL